MALFLRRRGAVKKAVLLCMWERCERPMTGKRYNDFSEWKSEPKPSRGISANREIFPKETVGRPASFKSNFSTNGSNEKPLVLILPWLGASSQAISKYGDLYRELGIEVMTHIPAMKDFLWPSSGLKSSLPVLDALKLKVQGRVERPIIIHSFSIGCYFYALMIMQMKKNEELYNIIWKNIAGQILDSPVMGTLDEMAFGVSKMTSRDSVILFTIYRSLCLWYFGMTRPFTVSYYDEAIAAIKSGSPRVPCLAMSCKDDPMLIPKALDDLVEQWRKEKSVTYHMWETSAHAQHLRLHPSEYKKLLNEFLCNCLSPQQSLKIVAKL